MNKNLLYIVNISDPSAKIDVNEYSQYCISTWKQYCDRHSIDLVVCNEHRLDPTMKPIWNKELIYDVGKGYEKIGIVDSDTLVRWDAPNIFDQITPDKFYGVNDLCDLNWLTDSIKERKKFFPGTILNVFKYINAGVLFFGSKYLYIFKELLDFYIANRPEIDKITTGGKEQTLLNFFLQTRKVDIELLDPSWNLLSIHRKNMFRGNWQLHPEFNGAYNPSYPETLPFFMKYAYVWHFTGFPIEDRISLMKQTWELIKEKYT